MVKEAISDVEGTILEVLGRSTFRVRLDNGAVAVAYAAGKARKNLKRAVAGERVAVQVAIGDATRGRILR